MLLNRLDGQLRRGESERILRLTKTTEQRIALRHNDVLLEGSQPTASGTPVRWAHQMYGLFRDGKAMSAMFRESQDRWRRVAFDMGADYHLWTADEVDTLMKNHFSFAWEVYQNVRYPVMRCDMGRVAVLYEYGGIYSDLAVFPNRMTYAQCDLAVCSAPSKNQRKKWYLDMEVIIGAPRNPHLLRWLHHMVDRVKHIQWTQKGSFWHTAKMRYIWHTTGPISMERFLTAKGKGKRMALSQQSTGLSANTAVKFSCLQCNRKDDSNAFDQMTKDDRASLDVITHTSISYKTSEDSVSVHVSSVSVALPEHRDARMLRGCCVTPMRRRLDAKQTVANDKSPQVLLDLLDAPHSQPAHSQPSFETPELFGRLAQSPQAIETSPSTAPEAVAASLPDTDRLMINEWTDFMVTCRNTAGFQSLWPRMPESMQKNIVEAAGVKGVSSRFFSRL